MHKLFKTLTTLAFVGGLTLFLGGNETYFSKSKGVGFVILVIGTPLFAFMASVFKETGNNQGVPTSASQPSGSSRSGLIMLTVGFLIYLSSFVGDQGLASLNLAALGALVGFIGLVKLFISALRR